MLFCFYQNNSLVVSETDYYNDLIPEAFNNFKIVQISDLHNKQFGKGQSKLNKQIEDQRPDVIVVTGDLIDRRKYDLEISMQFIRGAVEIAPVYYISGNHEAWSGKYPDIIGRLTEEGVHVLDDDFMEIERGGSKIKLYGVSDPDFHTSRYSQGTDTDHMEQLLHDWSGEEGFKILLSHRPELFELYSINNMDLIFSGHAHGGQFVIPLLGGVIAPDQGFFPEYTTGSYTSGKSTMFVSRGLGNSIIPVRIFNRPEIVAVTLKSID